MSAPRIWSESTLDEMGIMSLGLARPQCRLNPSLRSNICLTLRPIYSYFKLRPVHWCSSWKICTGTMVVTCQDTCTISVAHYCAAEVDPCRSLTWYADVSVDGLNSK